jgi:hypothetical protein
MTSEQLRIVKSEMIRYGVEVQAVAAVFGVDPSLVSHAIAGRFNKTERYRAMLGRMVLAKKLHVDPDEVPDKAITHWAAEFFPEE